METEIDQVSPAERVAQSRDGIPNRKTTKSRICLCQTRQFHLSLTQHLSLISYAAQIATVPSVSICDCLNHPLLQSFFCQGALSVGNSAPCHFTPASGPTAGRRTPHPKIMASVGGHLPRKVRYQCQVRRPSVPDEVSGVSGTRTREQSPVEKGGPRGNRQPAMARWTSHCVTGETVPVFDHDDAIKMAFIGVPTGIGSILTRRSGREVIFPDTGGAFRFAAGTSLSISRGTGRKREFRVAGHDR